MKQETRMQPKVGFIGLGEMGAGMAANLIRSGCRVFICDCRDDRKSPLIDLGASSVETPRDMAREADRIFLSLPGTEEVKSVLFGVDGITACERRDLLIVDLGTTHPLDTRGIAASLREKGILFLDAPVSGMKSRAEAGTLTIMVGGPEEAFLKVRDQLSVIGNKVLYMGGSGSGQLTKLVNQLLFNISAAAMAEILPMAVKMGLDPEKVCDVVTTGTGRSFALEFFTPLILKDDFGPGYALNSAYKDMVSAAEISSRNRIPLPVTAAATQTYQLALSRGLGAENKGAMIKVWEEVLGVRVRAGDSQAPVPSPQPISRNHEQEKKRT